MGGLSQVGWDTRILTHVPSPLWPRGPVRSNVRATDALDPIATTRVCGAWNIPFCRERLLAAAFLREIKKWVATGWTPDVVLSYNLPDWMRPMHAWLRRRLPNTKWVFILADAQTHYRGCSGRRSWADDADGIVFLSDHALRTADVKHKFHLDGGVTPSPLRPFSRENGSRLIVGFAGASSPWSGVDRLLAAMKHLPTSIEVRIFCHGDLSWLRPLASGNKNLLLAPFPSREELDRELQQIDVFVNPRPRTEEALFNFPSKVLDYLNWYRPVVSTWCDGFTPVYREFLTIVEDQPAPIAAGINEVAKWSSDKKAAWAERVRNWLAETHGWPTQAARLTEWLKQDILST